MSDHAARSNRARTILQHVLPPLAVFAIARMFLLIVASSAGFDGWEARNWAHWDSEHYLSIAQHGYTMYRSPIKPDEWDGNVGWMPGYSYAIRLLCLTGLRAETAGVIISAIFHLLSLQVIWSGFLGAQLRSRAVAALVLAGFWPCQVYQHAIFPISMCVFFVLLFMKLLLNGRWLWAMPAGIAAGFTYSTGFVLSPVAAIWVLISETKLDLRSRLLRVAVAGAAPIAGLVLVMAIHRAAVGTWWAFFMLQSRYGHGMHNPAAVFWSRARFVWLYAGDPNMQLLSAMLTATGIAVIVVVIATLLRWRRAERSETLIALYVAAFWLFSLTMGMHAVPWRAHAMLLPMAVFARRVPVAFQLPLIFFAAIANAALAVLFFRNVVQ